MSYKPKFCCQCGEKIERVDWKFLTSRRFCELCETELGIYDKIPLFLIAGGVLFGLFGIGAYLGTPDKTMNLAANNLVARSGTTIEPKQSLSQQVPSNAPVQTPQIPANALALTKNDLLTSAAKPKKESGEPVYFCGAPTKKGTPCSRRVKGGGRCWQHSGQTPMVAQEKLRVAN